MRILALTRNASLLVALGSMMRDWEVVSANDVAAASEVEPGSAVVLIDLGPTQEGLTAAAELYQHGVTIPCVVLGDEPADDPSAFVLVRPFSLEDLTAAVSDASTRPVAIAEPTRSAEKPATAAPAEGNGASLSRPPVATSQEEITPAPEASGAARVAEPAAPSEPTFAAEPERPTKPRPLTVVRPATETDEAAPQSEAVAPVTEAEGPPAPPTDVLPQQEPEVEPEPRYHTEPEPETEPAPQPPPFFAAPPPPAPRVERVQEAAPQRIAASSAEPAIVWTEPPQAQGRWRLRRKPGTPTRTVEQTAEPPLVGHLRQAARNASDLEKLIDELPFLADVTALADGLVAEVESQFSSLVASVFVERQDGFHAIAHRGLSHVESGMIVPKTQPLFSDVLQTGEGILIQPVDLAQGLVAGIGGARTEAIMAVPAMDHGRCEAIIIVGHDRFTETDLDRLTDLADEAAPGLAVALALARLRDRL